MLTHCQQDGEITVEYRPLEDTVDPSNMLCAGKVGFSSLSERGTATAAAIDHRSQSTVRRPIPPAAMAVVFDV